MLNGQKIGGLQGEIGRLRRENEELQEKLANAEELVKTYEAKDREQAEEIGHLFQQMKQK